VEIILAVVVAAAGLAMVWIALTFRARTERYSAPLISRSEEKVQKWLSQYYRSLEIGAQDGLNRFGGRLTALEKRIADAARRLDQLDGHLGQITRRIAGTESELGALHRQSTENARRHADELRQMRGDLKEAAGSSRETRGALTTLSGELREVQAALAALRQVPGRLNDTSQRVSDLDARPAGPRRVTPGGRGQREGGLRRRRPETFHRCEADLPAVGSGVLAGGAMKAGWLAAFGPSLAVDH
jgi:septal ring factor EnvC (AmiA/AmiB activator)